MSIIMEEDLQTGILEVLNSSENLDICTIENSDKNALAACHANAQIYQTLQDKNHNVNTSENKAKYLSTDNCDGKDVFQQVFRDNNNCNDIGIHIKTKVNNDNSNNRMSSNHNQDHYLIVENIKEELNFEEEMDFKIEIEEFNVHTLVSDTINSSDEGNEAYLYNKHPNNKLKLENVPSTCDKDNGYKIPKISSGRNIVKIECSSEEYNGENCQIAQNWNGASDDLLNHDISCIKEEDTSINRRSVRRRMPRVVLDRLKIIPPRSINRQAVDSNKSRTRSQRQRKQTCFQCTLCSDSSNIESHPPSHSGYCQFESDTSAQRKKLPKHKRRQSETRGPRKHLKEKSFDCALCGKSTSSKSDLERHLVFHSSECAFECDDCGLGFVSRKKLRQHARIHTGRGPRPKPKRESFECAACGETSSSKSNLKRHMLRHSGERPFACGACGQRFAQSTTLRRHERTHSGARPFECGACGHAFAQRGALLIHERTHSGECPYECGDCGVSYGRKDRLSAHRRAAHGDP